MMTAMDRESHWNDVYLNRQPESVSWYQREPGRSTGFIRKYAEPSCRIIDVGAGASLLVDALLDAGYANPIALDISSQGLGCAKARLGDRARCVKWIVADVTRNPKLPAVDLWHDRATLHFLADERERSAYARLVRKTVKPLGHMVIATFALDGPERCSGLPVVRHDGSSLGKLFGEGFQLLEETREVHLTPAGVEQRFCWTVFRRRSTELQLPHPSSIPAPFEQPTEIPM
jgi:hypothetical protein